MLMDKSVLEIAATETIVFAAPEIDMLISFTGSSLKWWYLSEGMLFMLTDALDVNNDLGRVTIAHARKLAFDWFNHELAEARGETVDMDEGAACPIPYHSGNYTPTTNTTTIVQNNKTDKDFPLVEPLELDHNKKDVHTEHCCWDHRHCKYDNKKCTVTTGKKKPSYPCNCDHY